MAFPPVAVFIGGQQLEGYTRLSLTRSKEELTGSCNIEIFFGYMPDQPVLVDAAIAKELLIYIGSHLAFTGTIDNRTGEGKHGGKTHTASSKHPFASTKHTKSGKGSFGTSIGPNDYSVTITGRGKTKRLIDSSHQHKSTNILKTNTRDALAKLLEPFSVQVDFMGTSVDLDKVRFRDGAKVVDEIRRLATENGYYIYETRDGKLRVTDDIGPGQGDALILGENIMTFAATQDEADSQSEITVKGQRTEKDVWGEEAILNQTSKVLKDSWVPSYAPIVVQHYGNATEAALERRARFEANKRSSRAKKVTIEVFHVMAQGDPWDIGNLHYVEVPPEGIFDTFECTGIQYSVDAEKTLKTTLTLSPPASGQKSASGLGVFEGAETSLEGIARKGALRVTNAPGSYPFPWAGATLVAQVAPAAVAIVGALAGVQGLAAIAGEGAPTTPPMTLPQEFQE